MPIPTKTRSGGSPQQQPTSLSTVGRNVATDSISSSLPNASAMEQVQNLLRRPLVETQEKRRSNSRDAKKGSPNRKSVELLPGRKSGDVTPSRRSIDLTSSLSRRVSSSQQRPSISAVFAPTSVNKVTVDAPAPYRYSNGGSPASTTPTGSSRGSGEREREKRDLDSKSRRRLSLESSMDKMSVSGGSSASSSDSGGSSETTTVVSDGGFTDYLSDESDVELQRQAEIRAAHIAQTFVEEQEFKAARQQLASVDLRPPKSWNLNAPGNSPRSQNTSHSQLDSAAYTPQFYSSSSYIAASSGSHSRA